jgi:hypothetical protein
MRTCAKCPNNCVEAIGRISFERAYIWSASVLVLPLLWFGFTGCASNAHSDATLGTRPTGSVFGGQQPVSGGLIQLYAVGTTGDGSAATPLISAPVTTSDGTGTTDSNANAGNANNTLPTGSFTITGDYTCPSASSEVYLVSTGGNAGMGSGTNANLTLITALGQCGSLSSSTYVVLNELTTVSTIAALLNFMTSYQNVGSDSSDSSLLQTAFSVVNEYTNVANGTAPGPALPTGYSVSSISLQTLGDIVASCVNSAGGVAGDSSPCGQLFNLATISNSPAPTDTVGAIIGILSQPTANVAQIFALLPANGPFQPTLSTAPANWELPITSKTATQLVFTVQPSGTAAGSTISPAVEVSIEDASGNPQTSATDTVTLAIGANPGSGALSGTIPVNAINGVAVFPDISINNAGTGYTLVASSPGLTSATSGSFNFTAGSPGTIDPYRQYSDITPGQPIAQDVANAAINYIGAQWGGYNCTGLVWAVSDATGADYYESAYQVASAAGETIPQIRTTVVPDPGNPSSGVPATPFGFPGYVLPSAGTYGQWITVISTTGGSDKGWQYDVAIGDLVRIPKSAFTNHSWEHSFIVVGGDQQDGWEVIDNTDPTAGNPVTISKHTFGNLSNNYYGSNFYKEVANASFAYISYLNPQANTVPVVTSISPNPAPESNSNQQLTIRGSNFQNGATLTYYDTNDTPYPDHAANFVNSGQLVDPAFNDDSDAGTWTVVVVNPGSQSSTAFNFTVSLTNPVPTITGLTPAYLAAGAASQNLTINGAGFLDSSTVTFNGIFHTATFVSASQLTISLTTADLATAGTYPVVVTNPAPGGGSSSAASFIVSSTPPLGSGEWTWVSGAGTVNQLGVYGTQGVPAATNVPGARTEAASWTDNNGNFWLFGGATQSGPFNDLWRFNPTNDEWAWMSGSSSANQPGVYGTQGVPAAANIPGSRALATTWTDSGGNLWLFGGSTDTNDLWQFNPATQLWTWISGSGSYGPPGVYGTQGAPAATNAPGGRNEALGWIDSSGNLWLFGGSGYDSAGVYGELNDLWEFSPTTKMWTWVSGSSSMNQLGVYGTQGVPAATNVPGGRNGAISWTDSSDNFWLFGGSGFDGSNDSGGLLNDLWEFNPTTKMWTWVSGSSSANQPGVYGTQGVPAATNIPGGREYAVSWIDGSGNLWLFGGGAPNDLWEFSPTSEMWTWVSGSSSGSQPGVYGSQGVPAAANVPGSRQSASTWVDGSGNLWLFGGASQFDGGGALNDLWRYQP